MHQNGSDPVLLVENGQAPTPPHRLKSPSNNNNNNNAISTSSSNNNNNINRSKKNDNNSSFQITTDDDDIRSSSSSSPAAAAVQMQNSTYNNNSTGKSSSQPHHNKINYNIANHINNNNDDGDDDIDKYSPSSSNPTLKSKQKLLFNKVGDTAESKSAGVNVNLNVNSDSGDGDGSHLNDSSSSSASSSSSSTFTLASSFSPSTSQSSASSALPPIARPLSTSTPKTPNGESARLNSPSESSPSSSKLFQKDKYSTPTTLNLSGENHPDRSSSSSQHQHHNARRLSRSSSSKTEVGVTVPHLTFSPETPPAAGLATPVNNFSPSVAHFVSSSSSSSPSSTLFGDFLKMKSTPGASGSGGGANGLSGLDVQKVLESSNHHHHTGNTNLSSIQSENSTANHSHSSSNISTEENFECLGEGTLYLDSHSEHTSLQYSRDVNDLSVPGDSPGAPPIRRNSWLRSSLRKSPQHQQQGSSPNGDSMGHRRWGSFRNSTGSKRPAVTSSSALANQLYRSSSFHSSGRSSAGDGEEMYSDGSLEDEVIDLTQKVHHLEEKFSVLAENQTDVDDRYVRIKQENAELSTKLFMSEEALREVEQRGEEKLRDEQRRFKDTLTRVDREKQLQIENYDIRLRSCEKELDVAKNDALRMKQKFDRERSDKLQYQDKVAETERELVTLKEDYRAVMEVLKKERDTYLLEASSSQAALQELRKEYEGLRKRHSMESSSHHDFRHHGGGHSIRFSSVDSESESAELKSRLHESEEENKVLKKQIRQLQETNDELSAQILNHGLEEGRHLLTVNCAMGDMGNSLAAEFEAMSEEELQKALKEQKEVNSQLRTYIDGILLNIVENYPQLLEVKRPSATADNSMEHQSSS